MKKIVFFDLDGTLTDSAPGIINAIEYARKKLNYRELTNKELQSCIGPPLVNSFMKLWNISLEQAESTLDVYREYYSEKGIFENSVYPKMNCVLQGLNQMGIECRICSAKPVKMINIVLNHFDLNKYFCQISGAELHGKFPGKSALIKSVLAKTGAQAIMIGDRKDDILGAKENHILSLGVLWGYGGQEELIKAGADYIVSKPEDILSVAKSVFSKRAE